MNRFRANSFAFNTCADMTSSSNVLFRVSDEVHKWSVHDVYQILGRPEMEKVVTRNGSPPGPFAPWQIVAPINFPPFTSERTSSSSILVNPSSRIVRLRITHPPCQSIISPEAFFDSKISFASDVWALACTIFEIRAGSPLFDSFLSSDTLILKQIVETLGRFPEPWWSAWEARRAWFDETGTPKPAEEQRKEGVRFIKNCATSGIRTMLQT
jgi:serine/threonine-protein kinase SRPK3